MGGRKRLARTVRMASLVGRLRSQAANGFIIYYYYLLYLRSRQYDMVDASYEDP